MKTALTFTILICVLSSCKKCYECRITQTSPVEIGVQFQTSTRYQEFCGNTKQLDRFIQETRNDNLVTIGGKVYESNVTVDCN